MNPHASYKCAGRLLMALAAITSILVTSGCGGSSSSTPPPNQSGFSNSSLSGTYVFSSQGIDVNGYPVAIAGAMVATGAGGNNGISGGTIDIVDPDPDFTQITPVAQSITGGSYSVNSDGRGQVSLASAYGTYAFDFVLSSTSTGSISEFDGNGTGSGTLDLQTAVTSLSQLAGPYAFSVAGSDAAGSPFAMAGAFTLGLNGSIAAGIEDFNDATVVGSESITVGAATLGSGSGPGTIPAADFNGGQLGFDYYPIDTTHFKLIETDYVEFLSGDAFTQTGASTIPTTAMAFTISGGVSTPIAAGGSLTVSGTSVSGTEDVNAAGSVVTGTTFSGTASAPGSVGGRVVVSPLSDFNPATKLVLYPSTGGTLMLEIDATNLTLGTAFAQTTGGAIAASQGYGFNLSGVNISEGAGEFFEEDDIAQFTTTSSSAFNGIVDENDEGTTTFDQALTGAYTASPNTATINVGGSEFVMFNYYPVSNSQFLFLETDNFQVGTGAFEAQSTPSSAAVAHRAIAMARPMSRSHGFKRRK